MLRPAHGRWHIEQVDVTALAEGLEGRAAWVASREAVEAVLDPADGPASLLITDLRPPALLSLAASAGHWCVVRSSHELRLSRAAGFPPERLVVAGRVLEEGLLKDALLDGVADIEASDAGSRANLERIARALGVERLEPSRPPRLLGSDAFDQAAMLLAPVLRGSEEVFLDAPLPAVPRAAWSLACNEDVTSVRLTGLSAGRDEDPHVVPLAGHVARGEWVLVATSAPLEARGSGPVHPPLPTVLVDGARWWILEPRPLPGD